MLHDGLWVFINKPPARAVAALSKHLGQIRRQDGRWAGQGIMNILSKLDYYLSVKWALCHSKTTRAYSNEVLTAGCVI